MRNMVTYSCTIQASSPYSRLAFFNSSTQLQRLYLFKKIQTITFEHN